MEPRLAEVVTSPAPAATSSRAPPSKPKPASSVKPTTQSAPVVLAPASSSEAAPVKVTTQSAAPGKPVDSQATEDTPDRPVVVPPKPTVPPSHRRPRLPPGTILAEETQLPTPPPAPRPTQRSSSRRFVPLMDDDDVVPPPSAQPRPSVVDTSRGVSPSPSLTRKGDPAIDDKTPLRSPPRPRAAPVPVASTSSFRSDNIFAPAGLVKRSVREEVEAKAGWHLHESTKKRLRAEAKAERKALLAAGLSIPSVGREDRFSKLGVNHGPIGWSDSSSQESAAAPPIVEPERKSKKKKRDSDVFQASTVEGSSSKRPKLEPGESRPGENFMRQIHRARNAEVFADPLKWKGRGRYADTIPGSVCVLFTISSLFTDPTTSRSTLASSSIRRRIAESGTSTRRRRVTRRRGLR